MNKEINNKVFIPIILRDFEEGIRINNLKLDRVRLLLSFIYLQLESQKPGDKYTYPVNHYHIDGYVSIHSDIIKVLLSTNYKHYINYLTEIKLLEVRESSSSKTSYIPGQSSINYRIIPDFMIKNASGKQYVVEYINDKTTLKSLNKLRHLAKRNKRKLAIKDNQKAKLFNKLNKMENYVRFDIDKIKQEFSSDETYKSDLNTLNLFNDAAIEMELNIDLFGERLHTPLKRIKGIYRKYTYFKHFEDFELASFDIKNSQLYFLTLLFNKQIVNNFLPEFSFVTEIADKYNHYEDVKEFIYHATNGTIYEHFQKSVPGINREQAKKLFLQNTYSKLKKYKVKDKFQIGYPNLTAFFNEIKTKDANEIPFETYPYYRYEKKCFESNYKNLCLAAQRLESRMFLQHFCGKLISNGIMPFYTVHDSIYFPKIYTNEIRTVFNQTFSELNICAPELKYSE